MPTLALDGKNLLRFLLIAPLFLATLAAAPPPKVVETKGPREVLLFSQKIRGHLVLLRSSPNGACRAFLSQGEQGFLSHPSTIKGDDFSGVSSPDGKHIAFYSTRSGSVNVWLTHADGTHPEQLTDEEQGIATLQADRDGQILFSPDSKALAYISNGDLWVIDLNTRNARALTQLGGVDSIAWSPDGRWLAYVKGSAIRRVGTSGTSDELLAADAAQWPSLSYLPDPKKQELLTIGRGALKLGADKKQALLYPFSLTPNRIQVAPGKGDNFIVLAYSLEQRREVFIISMTKKGKGGNEAVQITQGGAERAYFSLDAKQVYFVREGRLWRCDTQGLAVKPVTKQRVWTPSVGVLEIPPSRDCE